MATKTEIRYFNYYVNSQTLRDYFDIDDGTTSINPAVPGFSETIDPDVVGYYVLDCYADNVKCGPANYNLHWKVDLDRSELPAKRFDGGAVFSLIKTLETFATWQVKERINSSSPFAMASCGWTRDDDEEVEDSEESKDDYDEEKSPSCVKCDMWFKANSEDHDNMRCDDDGENWICQDCYDDEHEESDEDEDDDIWEELQATEPVKKIMTFVMAGNGTHWFNYEVEFIVGRCGHEQKAVYLVNRDGIKELDGQRLAYRMRDDGVEQVGLVDMDWTSKHDNEDLVFFRE